jgi:hypothetical protein
MTPTLIEQVRQFVALIAGWFEEDDSDETTLRYSTREHGSVYDEEPGQEDVRQARRIGRTAELRFPGLRVTVETVDEWTHLNLHLPTKTKQ